MMTDEKLRVAVVIASTRTNRFGETPGRWIADQVDARDDMVLDLVDLSELSLTHVLNAERTPDEVDYANRMGEADAFVIVTPEYNHSFPSSLKYAIDILKPQWQAKPVGFVSYGGISGGLRAVEQLRLVFAEVYAMTIRNTVSFHIARQRFDESGQPKDAEAVSAAATVMLNELAWWAKALRDARSKTPYPIP